MGDLSRLSVEELEQLLERVGGELTKRLCEKVDFKSFEFEPCDDRSMGSLKFTAQTSHGLLAYKSHLGNGYTDDVEVSLDGREDDGWGDCLEVPSFHDNTTQDEAKQSAAKAVAAFEEAYAEYLVG